MPNMTDKDMRSFQPSLDKGKNPGEGMAQTASKDSLTGKNSLTEYRTGKPSQGAGKAGGLNQRP